MLEIHQFSPSGFKVEMGVGMGMFYLQRILRSLGLISIYIAENIEGYIGRINGPLIRR